MDSLGTQEQIRELEVLRSQKRLWQLCLTLAVAVILVVCLLKMRSAAYGLVTDGPTKTAFVNDLSARLQQDAVPSIQEMGMQALHEINFADEVKKLNRRTPELAQASMQQMKLLGNDLADRGKKILDTTFTTALKQRESKIRTLFPEATDTQISELMTNLTSEAQEQIADINDDLFAPHKKALDGIVQDITLIQNQDATTVKGEQPTWEMGLLVFDLARNDLKGLETTEDANGTTVIPARSVTEKKK
jgi:hypothetical protein